MPTSGRTSRGGGGVLPVERPSAAQLKAAGVVGRLLFLKLSRTSSLSVACWPSLETSRGGGGLILSHRGQRLSFGVGRVLIGWHLSPLTSLAARLHILAHHYFVR